MAVVPHFDYPFRVVGGGVRTVEQDTVQDVAVCVYAILATELGSRQEEPDFGLIDQAFRQGGVSIDELREAVSDWEPRADLLDGEDWDDLTERVSIRVGVKQ